MMEADRLEPFNSVGGCTCVSGGGGEVGLLLGCYLLLYYLREDYTFTLD